MIDILIDQARNAPDPKDRIKAADLVLDRAIGRAITIGGDDEAGGPTTIIVRTGCATPPEVVAEEAKGETGT
jgi:hypothetical protein